MPTLHPVPARPPQPSRYRDGYCETPYCWTRESVYYDHVSRLHQCPWCWASREGTNQVVIPKPPDPPAMPFINRVVASLIKLRLPR